MKEAVYRRAAAKGLRKLPAEIQERIKEAIAAYTETGDGNVTPLKGRDGARLRVGKYRVIFTETEDEIEIFQIGHRKDVYR